MTASPKFVDTSKLPEFIEAARDSNSVIEPVSEVCFLPFVYPTIGYVFAAVPQGYQPKAEIFLVKLKIPEANKSTSWRFFEYPITLTSKSYEAKMIKSDIAIPLASLGSGMYQLIFETPGTANKRQLNPVNFYIRTVTSNDPLSWLYTIADDLERFMKGSQIQTSHTYNEAHNIQKICTYAAKTRGVPVQEQRLNVDTYAIAFWEEKFKDKEDVAGSRLNLWKTVLPNYVSTVMANAHEWMNGLIWGFMLTSTVQSLLSTQSPGVYLPRLGKTTHQVVYSGVQETKEIGHFFGDSIADSKKAFFATLNSGKSQSTLVCPNWSDNLSQQQTGKTNTQYVRSQQGGRLSLLRTDTDTPLMFMDSQIYVLPDDAYADSISTIDPTAPAHIHYQEEPVSNNNVKPQPKPIENKPNLNTYNITPGHNVTPVKSVANYDMTPTNVKPNSVIRNPPPNIPKLTPPTAPKEVPSSQNSGVVFKHGKDTTSGAFVLAWKIPVGHVGKLERIDLNTGAIKLRITKSAVKEGSVELEPAEEATLSFQLPFTIPASKFYVIPPTTQGDFFVTRVVPIPQDAVYSFL